MIVQPLRRVFKVVNGGTPTSEPENWDGEVAWATPIDLGRLNGSRISETQRTITTEGLRTGSSLVPAGSLIVSTRAPIGYVVETMIPMAFNQGCRGLVPLTELDVRFFRYQLLVCAGQLQSRGQGSTFVELSTDGLASFPLAVAPLRVQRAIADYLDAETARIHALIASRRRMIELLRERRSAVIADLTGGDTGTGEAAGGTRLKFAVGRPTSGNRDHSFTSDDSGIPCLRGLNIKPGWVDQANLMRISEADNREHGATILHAGDVVIVRSGNAGTAAMVPPELDGANCVDLVIIRRSANVEPRYLEYLLNSPQARTQAEMGVFGATLTHFNAVDIGELTLFIPPVGEQRALVSLLEERTSRIDSTVEAMQRQVATLLERRQALITAAVTGQLEIPGVAA